MMGKFKKTYTHVHRVEDIWVYLHIDEDITRLYHNRLILQEIMDLDLADILDDMEDDEDILEPIYISQNIVDTPLPPIQWSQKECVPIRERF